MATTRKAQVSVPRPQAERFTASASTTGDTPPEAKIAVRAYEIWQESGCPEGKHEEHWYRAERELRARSTPNR